MYIALTRTRIIVLGILVAAGAAAWTIWALVDTDSKRIGRTLTAVEHAVEKGDMSALAALTDNDCLISGIKAADFLKWYGSVQGVVGVKDVSLYDLTITFDPKDTAHATATVLTFIQFEKHPELRVDWRIEFRKHEHNEWKLLSARAFLPPPAGTEIPLRTAYDWLR